MYIMWTRRSYYRIIKYMEKSIQNWESLQGNKTNTFVISGHVYFVCTTYVATAISCRPYLYDSIRNGNI
jgi:hypothetical protein